MEMNRNEKIVCGIGVNDVKKCEKQIYATWNHMLDRCYSQKCQERNPTYKGCFVCSDWLTLSNFRSWFLQSNWKPGLALDKDITNRNNKEYGPTNCSFVSVRVNSLIVDCGATRGNWPIGVYLNKPTQKYIAQIRINGKLKHIGRFSSPSEAHEAYKIEKLAYMKVVAEEELAAGNITKSVYEALVNWMI